MIYTYHLKDVNNHNSFFGTDSHVYQFEMCYVHFY